MTFILMFAFLGASVLIAAISWTLGTRYAEWLADKVASRYVRKSLDNDLKGAAHV
jgi:hypothetical protein